MNFAKLAQVCAVRVQYCGGVVIDPIDFHFVDRYNHNHPVFLGIFSKTLGGGTRDRFGVTVPFNILLGTKIGTVENFLQTEDINLILSSLFDQRDMFLDHGFFDFSGCAVMSGIGCLDVGTFYKT